MQLIEKIKGDCRNITHSCVKYSFLDNYFEKFVPFEFVSMITGNIREYLFTDTKLGETYKTSKGFEFVRDTHIEDSDTEIFNMYFGKTAFELNNKTILWEDFYTEFNNYITNNEFGWEYFRDFIIRRLYEHMHFIEESGEKLDYFPKIEIICFDRTSHKHFSSEGCGIEMSFVIRPDILG